MPAQSAFHKAELTFPYPINIDFTSPREIIPPGGFTGFDGECLVNFLSDIDDLFEGGDPAASASAVRNLVKKYLQCDGCSFAFRHGPQKREMDIFFESAHDKKYHTGKRVLDLYEQPTETGGCLLARNGYGKNKITNMVQRNPARSQKIEKSDIGYPVYSQIVVCAREGGRAFSALNVVNKTENGTVLQPSNVNNHKGFTYVVGVYLWNAAQVMQPHLHQWARQLGYLD